MAISVGNRTGKFTRKISVKTNDRDALQTTLECVAQARCALKVDPTTVNFGQIARNAEAQTKTIKIQRGDGGPIKPQLVNIENKNVEAEMKEILAGEEYELTVKILPPWPNNMLRSSLHLETGVEQSPRESLTVFARIKPRLVAVPNRFTIPREMDEELDLTARLSWSDSKPGRVLEASVDNPRMKVEITEEDDQQKVVLHVPVDYQIGKRPRYTVKLKTDDDEAPTLDIPVYAMVPRRPTPPPSAERNAPRTPAARPQVDR